MTIKVYIGTGGEIAARFIGPPPAFTTTITAVSAQFINVVDPSGFAPNNVVIVNQQKRTVIGVAFNTVTLDSALDPLPILGDIVRHYDADYSNSRTGSLSWTDDLKTGGKTGDDFGQDIVLVDYGSILAPPTVGQRVTMFDDVDPDIVLFGGVIQQVTKTLFGKQNNGLYAWQYTVRAAGYQIDADAIGIEEQPQFNVNAGKFLESLRTKYTTLNIGEIDTVNSPILDIVRLGNYRRFSDVGRDLSALWPGSEFYIAPGKTDGKVFFRQATASIVNFRLSESEIERKSPFNVKITTDLTKTANIVRLPYWQLQRREPDFFTQDTVGDSAFLKTSVVLNGQPIQLEESQLILDDFTGSIGSQWIQDDVTNPSPPLGFIGTDGYLVQGDINNVTGLHLLNTASASPTIRLGDICQQTNPLILEPWTGKERQLLFAQELVVNTLGDAIIMGIIDQSTVAGVIQTGATTTSITLDDATAFKVGDRITVSTVKSYITAKAGNTLTITALPVAPSAGVICALHQAALSRVVFGVYFKLNGDLKAILNGVETAFATPRTYTATTYSLRLNLQSFESAITGGITSTGCTLNSATDFAVNDVIEIDTSGGRKAPETRIVLTKIGAAITFAALATIPVAGYRVRTKPKLVLQIKGGAFGSITGRAWTTIYNAPNTYQLTTAEPDERGVLLAMHNTLVATLTLFQVKDPIPVTAKIADRYLHIGTQETDSSEPDIDCIIRKVGSHYQLDFFSDTKALWSSGSRLEVRYNERFMHHMEETDTGSMVAVAKLRGFPIPELSDEVSLRRLGGIALDTLQINPNPLTVDEASSLTRQLLDAVKDIGVKVEIDANTVLDSIVSAGDTLASDIPGVSNLVVERVQIAEIEGVKGLDGRARYAMKIYAGSIDRLKDFLIRRESFASRRLVLDDGQSDDSFTLIRKINLLEAAITRDVFETLLCQDLSTTVWNGFNYSLIRCILIPVS